MANNTPSMYADLWLAIKKDSELPHPKGVAIAAHPLLHRRIIRAVQNRKLKDIAFQFTNSDIKERGHCMLVSKCDASRITFSLKYSTGLGDL